MWALSPELTHQGLIFAVFYQLVNRLKTFQALTAETSGIILAILQYKALR